MFYKADYIVRNYYDDYMLEKNPPKIPDISQLIRAIHPYKHSVTTFDIDWDEDDDSSDNLENSNSMNNVNKSSQKDSNLITLILQKKAKK